MIEIIPDDAWLGAYLKKKRYAWLKRAKRKFLDHPLVWLVFGAAAPALLGITILLWLS